MPEIATCAAQTCLQIFVNDRVQLPRESCHDTKRIRSLLAFGDIGPWHRCDTSRGTSLRPRKAQDQDCPWRPTPEYLLSLARNARSAEVLGPGGVRRRSIHRSEFAAVDSAFGRRASRSGPDQFRAAGSG